VERTLAWGLTRETSHLFLFPNSTWEVSSQFLLSRYYYLRLYSSLANLITNRLITKEFIAHVGTTAKINCSLEGEVEWYNRLYFPQSSAGYFYLANTKQLEIKGVKNSDGGSYICINRSQTTSKKNVIATVALIIYGNLAVVL